MGFPTTEQPSQDQHPIDQMDTGREYTHTRLGQQLQDRRLGGGIRRIRPGSASADTLRQDRHSRGRAAASSTDPMIQTNPTSWWGSRDARLSLGLSMHPFASSPKGSRTPVAGLRGRCPSPLDDGAKRRVFYQASTNLSNRGRRRRRRSIAAHLPLPGRSRACPSALIRVPSPLALRLIGSYHEVRPSVAMPSVRSHCPPSTY